MSVTIRRVCHMCGDQYEDGMPTCECCPDCGGTPDGDYCCDDCIDARDAAKEAARVVWRDHLKKRELK